MWLQCATCLLDCDVKDLGNHPAWYFSNVSLELRRSNRCFVKEVIFKTVCWITEHPTNSIDFFSCFFYSFSLFKISWKYIRLRIVKYVIWTSVGWICTSKFKICQMPPPTKTYKIFLLKSSPLHWFYNIESFFAHCVTNVCYKTLPSPFFCTFTSQLVQFSQALIFNSGNKK